MSHDDKELKPRFDSAGYDKDLVEALERDIVQTNPNVKWWVLIYGTVCLTHSTSVHSTTVLVRIILRNLY